MEEWAGREGGEISVRVCGDAAEPKQTFVCPEQRIGAASPDSVKSYGTSPSPFHIYRYFNYCERTPPSERSEARIMIDRSGREDVSRSLGDVRTAT